MTTAPLSNLTATWNSAGTTFTAVKMNVTDTASAAGSLLLDLQVGGTSHFHVTKGGAIHSKRSLYNISSANVPIVTVSNYSLTGSNADSLFDLAGTWNTSGTPTALKLNVTDTASAAGSLLLDLQVGGNSKLSVTKSGRIQGNSVNAYIFLDNAIGSQFAYGTSLIINGGNGLDIYSASNPRVSITLAGRFVTQPGGSYCFNATADGTSSPDTILARDAAGILAQRNSTNAQAFRVYNTFTDASNYERGKMEWASNVFQIGTEKAGTGTARALELQTNGTTRWTIAATSNNLTSDMGGAGVVGFEGGSVFTASGSVFKSRGIAYLDSTTGAVNLRPGGGTALSATSSGIAVTGFTEMTEQTAPAAPAANGVRIYAVDNGSGKTQLMALFATGAAVQIAIEP